MMKELIRVISLEKRKKMYVWVRVSKREREK
jgi:hypothetical protein